VDSLEIHHDKPHANDPAARRVAIQAAVLGVLLAIVTIASHRTHTAAIIFKSSSNDQWAYYQATRLKLHGADMGEKLIRTIGPHSEVADQMIASYEQEKTKYEAESAAIQKKASEEDHAAESAEHRALRYDVGEGMLEIGLVLSSLYFIANRSMFPVLGLIAAITGLAVASTGLLL
jgi:hypothetical protein